MGFYPKTIGTELGARGRNRTALFHPVRPTLLRSAISSGPETHIRFFQLQERGQRFNNPEVGRWLNRDPIGEMGGWNLLVFVGNQPVLLVDIDGYGWFAPPGSPPGGWNGPPVIISPPVPSNPGSPFIFIVETPEQTNLIKNDPDVRDKVVEIISNMLAARDSSCPSGVTEVITKSFPSVSIRALADNYDKQYPWELGYFLGHTSVALTSFVTYNVDCCKGKFKFWEISVSGSFSDPLDDFLPGGFPPSYRNPWGSLPVIFRGSWTERYSGL